MRFGTIFCFALAVCLAHAEDSTEVSTNGTTLEPATTTPSTPSTSPPTSSVPPVTTTVPPPAPTDVPPTVEKFIVNGTDSVCILANFAAQVLITYENTANKTQTATLNVANATVDEKASNCGANTSVLSLDFGGDHLVLNFVNDNGKYVKEVVLHYVADEKIFPGHPQHGQKLVTTFSNLTLFQVSDNDKSYTCASEEAKNSEATIKFTAIQVESFRTAKTSDFSQAQDCATGKVSDLVPIAVGCALLALVLIVLIAYFIGRRRSRRLAYQSV